MLFRSTETFPEAAIRETKEEAGIDIALKGILRIEHSLCGERYARMRVVFYAEPISPLQPPKSISDKESEMALWVTLDQFKEFKETHPGIRGYELLDWGNYIEKGGIISPLEILSYEGCPLPPIKNTIDEPINSKNWTKLHLAIKGEDVKSIEKLLKNGANIGAETNDGRYEKF